MTGAAGSSPRERSRACCDFTRRSASTESLWWTGCHGASREVGARVEAAVEPGARLERFDGPERFDILPLLVCTDGAVWLFGRDVRRLRPNLVIGGVEDAERTGRARSCGCLTRSTSIGPPWPLRDDDLRPRDGQARSRCSPRYRRAIRGSPLPECVGDPDGPCSRGRPR